MSEKKVWLITGAGRGMGVDIAGAALTAGHAVVAAGRNTDTVTAALGKDFYAGFFEEISPEDFRAQVETTLFGPMNVTRAVLPVMRAQRSGLLVAISSTAGIAGQEFCTAYAASKFGGRAGLSH